MSEESSFSEMDALSFWNGNNELSPFKKVEEIEEEWELGEAITKQDLEAKRKDKEREKEYMLEDGEEFYNYKEYINPEFF